MNSLPKCPVTNILQHILKTKPKQVVAAKDRTKKKNLHLLTSFFIAETWKLMIQNGLEQKIINSLKAYPDSFHSMDEYIVHLNKRSPCFGWAWIRARIEDQVEKALDEVLESVINSHPEKSKKYQALLLKNGFYWFRQSIRHHLRLGYHTGVSVIIKFIGTYKYESNDKFNLISPEYKNFIYEACKKFAAFDLELLLASDRVLWDSAAATSYKDYQIEYDQLLLPHNVIDKVLANFGVRTKANKKNIYEAMLGCPALRADLQVSEGVEEYKTVFEEFYMVLLRIVDYNKFASE